MKAVDMVEFAMPDGSREFVTPHGDGGLCPRLMCPLNNLYVMCGSVREAGVDGFQVYRQGLFPAADIEVLVTIYWHRLAQQMNPTRFRHMIRIDLDGEEVKRPIQL